MKPVYIGLLVFAATVGIGLLAILAFAPKPESLDIPAPPAAAIEPMPTAQVSPAPERATKSTARKTAPKKLRQGQQMVPLNSRTTSAHPTGGIFSGSDPSDPRVYH